MNTIMSDKIGVRLKEIRKHFDLTQDEFAQKLDLSKSFVGKIEAGFQQPSATIMVKLFEIFNVSLDWLLTGRGQMFIMPEDHYLYNLDNKTIEILGLIDQKLTDDEKLHLWDSVRSILRAILANKQQ